MFLVEAGQKGKNIKLHPQAEHKIFTDITTDGKDVVIVKGRVVRVDSPSAEMGKALSQQIYLPDPAGKKAELIGPITLLVETDEAPTPLDAMEARIVTDDRAAQEAQMRALASKLGFTVSGSSENEGDVTVDESGKASVKTETKTSSDSKK